MSKQRFDEIQTTKPQTDNELDKILGIEVYDLGTSVFKLVDINNAKQAILKNYRHIDDIRGAIGEDEYVLITDTETVDYGKKAPHPYNDLRQTIRQALNIGDSDE